MSGPGAERVSRFLLQAEDIPAGARILVYGTGARGRQLAGAIQARRPDVGLLGFVDSHPHGDVCMGLPLYGPDDLADQSFDTCVIASSYYPEIIRELRSRGVERYAIYFDQQWSVEQTDSSALVCGEDTVLALELQRRLIRRALETGLLARTLKARPGPLYVNVTNMCNARCVFCAQHRNTDRKLLMEHELFVEVVRKYVQGGGEHLDLTPMVGDCLVDPGVVRKISAAKELGIKRISLITNGIGLKRLGGEGLDVLAACVDTIGISTPGLSPAAYRDIYRVDACQQVTAGLRALAEAKARGTGNLSVTLVFRTPRSAAELAQDEGMLEIMECIEAGLINVDLQNRRVEFDNLGGMVEESSLPEGLRVKDYWLPEEGVRPPCLGLLSGFIVLPDGRAKLCGCAYSATPFNDFIIGDCRTTPMDALLFGEAHRGILEGFYREIPKICRNCSRYIIPSQHPPLRSMLASMLLDAPQGMAPGAFPRPGG